VFKPPEKEKLARGSLNVACMCRSAFAVFPPLSSTRTNSWAATKKEKQKAAAHEAAEHPASRFPVFFCLLLYFQRYTKEPCHTRQRRNEASRLIRKKKKPDKKIRVKIAEKKDTSRKTSNLFVGVFRACEYASYR